MDLYKNTERYYNNFINTEQPFAFFSGLAKYLEYVYSANLLKKEFDKQLEVRRGLYKEIEDIENKIIKDLKQAKAKLVALIEKNKVDITSFKRHNTFPFREGTTILQECDAYENTDDNKPRAFGSVFVSDEVHRHLLDLIINLVAMGYENDLKDFVKPSKNIILSEFFPSRYEKQRLFENQKLLSDWGAFEKLLRFKTAYDFALSRDSHQKMSPENGIEKEHWFGSAKEAHEIDSMARELQMLIENNKDFFSRINMHYEPSRQNEQKYLDLDKFRIAVKSVHNRLLQIIEENDTKLQPKASGGQQKKSNWLSSIQLVTEKLEPQNTIFLVLNEFYERPFRFSTKNNKGEFTAIKKLYDIAYIAPHAPGKKVDYDKRTADNINNGIFKRTDIKKFIETNNYDTGTIVKKSEDKKILALSGGVLVATVLIKNIPHQHQYLYLDKTK